MVEFLEATFSGLLKAAIFLFCLFLLFFLIFYLSDRGIFVKDHSADVRTELMYWRGKTYVLASGEYSEGKRIAKSTDGSWDINEVKEDPSHTFVVVRSFLDDTLYVADDYAIPETGNITKVYWNRERIEDEEFLGAITEIMDEKTTPLSFDSDTVQEFNGMGQLYLAYEGCPVATIFKGYMGKAYGKWVITTYISPDQYDAYAIPEKYWSVLEKYFWE